MTSQNITGVKEVVEQFTDNNVTFSEESGLIFIGGHLTESQKNKINTAVDVESIEEADERVTRIRL